MHPKKITQIWSDLVYQTKNKGSNIIKISTTTLLF
jgi:hypothetical protein